MYDDVNLTKPRREPKYNALVSYTRMRRKLKIEYLLLGGRVVQARCRILSSLLRQVDARGVPQQQVRNTLRKHKLAIRQVSLI